MADPIKKGTKSDDQPQVKGAPTAEDLGLDAGYLGVKVDPLPNEAYSLESGPDGPGLLEARHALVESGA